MALAEMEPAVARVDSLPVASSADGRLVERVLLAIIAALAAVLVPGDPGRLIDSPLTWTDLACGLRHQRRRGARLQIDASMVSITPWRPRTDRSR